MTKIFFLVQPLFLVTAVFITIFSPLLLFAQVEITEIMYDLQEGGDVGREWVEIHNTSLEDIDLSSWCLFEAETNHRINAVIEGDSVILSANSYALLVDNFDKFKIDYPNYSSVTFDSVFSLSNTGENLILRDGELNDIDRVEYSKEQGAAGDGNSLQKIDEVWRAARPTPGEVNFLETTNPETGSELESQINIIEEESENSEESSQTVAVFKTEPQVFAEILPFQNKPIAGADFLFEGVSRGLQGRPLENATYQWTFGDGGKAKGEKVLHAYFYPGKYLVVLQVISGKYVGTEKKTIEVLPADLFISQVNTEIGNQFIELSNPTDYELNLSWWRIKVDGNYYTLPKNTIILPKTNVKLSANVLGCLLSPRSMVTLLYPNGSEVCSLAVSSQEPKVIPTAVASVPSVSQSASLVESLSQEKPKKALVQESADKSVLQEKQPEKEVLSFSTTTSPQISQTKSDDSIKNTKENKFFNKWNLFLVIIIVLAIFGVVLVNRLDRQMSVK